MTSMPTLPSDGGGIQGGYSRIKKSFELLLEFCKSSFLPAKAGIQSFQGSLDPGFRRGDKVGFFKSS